MSTTRCPAGTLALAMHRLDSSTAPLVRILSTPTYPGAGIEPEYRAGDQRRFFIPCAACEVWQPLEWEKNVVEQDGQLIRACVECRASLEDVVAEAWEREGFGEWRPTNPDAPHHSYQLGRLYRPTADLEAIAAALRSSNEATVQEAWNQHLGLPYSPVGGQLSLHELERICTGNFNVAEVAGIEGCWMGVDVGARLHVWIEHAADRRLGNDGRYLVAALEVDGFEQLDELMHRFGVSVCVIDAHPDFHAARQFQQRWWGRVYLADYVRGRLPLSVTHDDDFDVRRMYRVQIDRTGAMDQVADMVRAGYIRFPRDAASIPGLFAHLQARRARRTGYGPGRLRRCLGTFRPDRSGPHPGSRRFACRPPRDRRSL